MVVRLYGWLCWLYRRLCWLYGLCRGLGRLYGLRLGGQEAELAVDLLRVAAQDEQQQRELKGNARRDVADHKQQNRAEEVGKQHIHAAENERAHGDAI